MTNNRWVRNSLIYLLIIIGVIVIFYTLIPSFGSSEPMSLKQVLDQSRGGQIKQIIVDGEKLSFSSASANSSLGILILAPDPEAHWRDGQKISLSITGPAP